ncbi:hypothetical protein FHR32_007539 [Streptosporangium album]|uniref:S-adenosyl methyltransferase n=1 Tax=Streptosporangium album TaxID=47479 RepID=A0A7W7WE94_9ACTN|nr:SAM-dependent methyltransferase [Streptosporangium album]MBB4943139.1 hypothetical protein [Streptosporangium album]
MSDAAPRPPVHLDTSVPNVARMNDYFLGGKDNFAADRQAAEEVLAIAPEIRTISKEIQAFLGRAVRHLIDQGVTQFLAVEPGLPTQRNVHQVAQAIEPAARVAYVADDPVVLSHAQAILATDPRTIVVRGDVLHPDDLLAEPELRRFLDLDQPVAVVIPSALHFIPDEDDPFKNVALLRDALPVGSYLALAHVVFDTRPEAAGPLGDIYRKILNRSEDVSRTRRQVLRFFDGLELVEPGLVYVRQWRPDSALASHRPEKAWSVAGVARKTDG